MIRLTILAVFLILSIGALPAAADEPTAAEWQEDLDELSDTIKDKHKNPFHRVSEGEFDRAVMELRAEIPRLDPEQVLVGLVRIGAMIGDGHTAVRPYDRFDVYPLKLFWFGEELRVTGAAPAYREILGWRVTRIGDTALAEAARAVDPLTPQGENHYFVMIWSGYWLKNPQVLHVLGISDSARSASYTFEDDSGRVRTLELEAIDNDEYGSVAWESAYEPKPAFLQSQEEAIRLETFADGAALYVSFRSYPGKREMRRISKEVRERIEEGEIGKLIVDLRGNGGGNFNRGLDLIKEIRKTKIQERGAVFTLTDRWTFSAAMSNAAHFRDQLGAILVGEPAGERPNGYAENHGFELPHSGVSASCSSRYYEFQEEDTPTLEPDHVVPPDLAAWSEGRDPVLEWVLAQ